MSEDTPAAAWCMLHVRPGKEQAARNSFRRHGVRAYWPNFHSAGRWSPNTNQATFKRDALRSVIPGYLFVVPDPLKTFWEVMERYVEDVAHAVRNFSGGLAMIRDVDMEVIRKIEEAQQTPEPGKSLHSFKAGDKVRFKDDTVHRWPPGRIVGGTNDGHLTVEVEVMGRAVPIYVLPYQIERA